MGTGLGDGGGGVFLFGRLRCALAGVSMFDCGLGSQYLEEGEQVSSEWVLT